MSFIEERKYQTYLLSTLKKIHKQDIPPPPVMIELDCGMGKRIISYLLVSEYFPSQKTLILLQATSSLSETADFFQNKYKMEIGILGSRTPAWKRESILQDYRVVLATPQTLANVYKKNPSANYGFEIILINEVDKLIRRTATRRNLVFPYPDLIDNFQCQNNDPWIIGLSGTLRDSHIIVTDRVRLKRELQTLADNFPNVRVITMDEIMSVDEDFSNHINYTALRGHAVYDDDIYEVFTKLDELVLEYRNEIIREARAEGLIDQSTKNLALIAGNLAVDSSLTGKYNSLLLMRKYVSAMLPLKYKPFLKRFPEFSNEEVEMLSDKSKKLQELPTLLKNHKKSVIMVSYIFTGDIICKYLEKAGYTTFMISGKVNDKNAVINQFRECESDQVALIMTQVGERDLDIPQADLIVVYDMVNTVKTMYQRFKRTRGGEVICMFYAETSEQKKAERLFKGVKEKYLWSTKVEEISF